MFFKPPKPVVVASCKEAIQIVSVNKRVYIYWVQGHTYLEGNQIADELAKKGVYLAQNAASNLLVPFKKVKKKQKVILLRQENRRSEDCIIEMTLCKTKNTKLTKFVLSVKGLDPMLRIGLLTGYCLPASHAFNMDLTKDNECRKCKECAATEEHVICECPAFGRQRLYTLDAERLQHIQSPMAKRPVQLLNFPKREIC